MEFSLSLIRSALHPCGAQVAQFGQTPNPFHSAPFGAIILCTAGLHSARWRLATDPDPTSAAVRAGLLCTRVPRSGLCSAPGLQSPAVDTAAAAVRDPATSRPRLRSQLAAAAARRHSRLSHSAGRCSSARCQRQRVEPRASGLQPRRITPSVINTGCQL